MWVAGLAGAVVASFVLLAVALGAFRSPSRSTNVPEPAGTPAEQTSNELRDLRRAVANPAEDKLALRKRVLEIRASHPGTPLAATNSRRLANPL